MNELPWSPGVPPEEIQRKAADDLMERAEAVHHAETVRRPRSIVVSYWGGQDTWADAGIWEISEGVLKIRHVETNQVMVIYGASQWIRARITPIEIDGEKMEP